MKMTKLLLSLALCFSFLTYNAQVMVSGCLDPLAANFNPEATVEDGTCCYSDHFITVFSDDVGESVLYNLTDGTSQFYVFPGSMSYCTGNACFVLYLQNYTALEFACSVSIDGGPATVLNYNELNNLGYNFSVGTDLISGCNDPNSCNFNPLATCNDGSCSYDCYGCTDPGAPNYSPLATIDNGSCCDADSWYTFTANVPCIVTFASGDFVFYTSIDYPNENGICIPSDCIQMQIQFSDPNETLTYSLTSFAGEIVASGSGINSYYTDVQLTLNGAIAGCTDLFACNYNPLATCTNYAICDYSCQGCTNPDAPNFDPSATVDNGSCCTDENWLSVVASDACFVHIFSYYWGDAFNQYLDLTSNSTTNICIPDGCYSIEITNLDYLQEANVQVIDSNGNVFYDGTTSNAYILDSFSKNGIIGCTVDYACNYDPNVTCSNNNLCTFDCYGCTNPEAGNYDPNATIDNGTCCLNQYTIQMSGPGVWSAYSILTYASNNGSYPEMNSFCVQDGCFAFYVYSPTYEQLSYSILDENGNILLEGETDVYGQGYANFEVNATAGCTDYSACNYDPTANCMDNSCTYDCYGCTDPNAGNYDPAATLENYSCCYDTWYTISFSEEAYWSVYASYNYGAGSYQNTNGFCMDDQCFNLSVYSLLGLPMTFTIYSPDGSIFYTGSTNESGYAYVTFTNDDVYGCMDPSACNYDPTATCTDYYVCNYDCLGCTNPEAGNYDPDATLDNGTCCLNDWYTIQMSGAGYWTIQNYNAGIYTGGNYPESNGFCADASCFGISVYSYGAEPIEFYVINPQGETIYYGLTGVSGYFSGSVSTTGEISGCTVSGSCNYNPEATCDDGSCNYYCGGCLDPTALNYNPLAWYDDSFCIFNPEAPMLDLSVETNEFEEVYYVRMDMVSLGNGAPYILSSDYNTEMLMIDDNGQYFAGPFPCGEDVVMTVQSAQLGMTEYMVSDPLSGSCSITTSVVETTKSATSLYPNPTSGLLNITGLKAGKLQIEMYDMTGRLVYTSAPNNVGNNFSFDATELSEGVYQLHVINNGQSEFHQVVISR